MTERCESKIMLLCSTVAREATPKDAEKKIKR